MDTNHVKSTRMVSLARGLLQIFYPNLCWVCRQPIALEQRGLCSKCQGALFTNAHESCVCCAATVGSFTVTAEGCPACRNQGFAFRRTIRLGVYEGLLREVILRCKSPSATALAEIVAEEWAGRELERFKQLGIDCVVPVPLHWWRRWQRGCNQSDALANAFADALHVSFQPYALRRTRATAMQSKLSPTARRENVHNAFKARPRVPLTGKKVLLVDDVMTTGSTAHEAARALRQAGAAEVVVAVLARAEG